MPLCHSTALRQLTLKLFYLEFLNNRAFTLGTSGFIVGVQDIQDTLGPREAVPRSITFYRFPC